MDRDSFIFYRSVWDVALQLSDEDRLKYYDRVIKYWLYWEDESCGWIVDMMFTLIKPNLDANNKRFSDWWKWWRPRKKPLVIDKKNQRLKKNKPNEEEEEVEEDVNDNVDVKEETPKTAEAVPVKKKSIINKNNKAWAIEIYDKIKEMCVIVDWTLDDCVVLRSKLQKYWDDPVKLLWILITKMRETWQSKFYSVSSPWKLADNLWTIVEKLKSNWKEKKELKVY